MLCQVESITSDIIGDDMAPKLLAACESYKLSLKFSHCVWWLYWISWIYCGILKSPDLYWWWKTWFSYIKFFFCVRLFRKFDQIIQIRAISFSVIEAGLMLDCGNSNALAMDLPSHAPRHQYLDVWPWNYLIGSFGISIEQVISAVMELLFCENSSQSSK